MNVDRAYRNKMFNDTVQQCCQFYTFSLFVTNIILNKSNTINKLILNAFDANHLWQNEWI